MDVTEPFIVGYSLPQAVWRATCIELIGFLSGGLRANQYIGMLSVLEL